MQRPLTIALANSGRPWVGEIAHVAMLYEQLDALGHRPWIFARRGYALEAHAQARGWRVVSLNFSSHLDLRRDWQDLRRWRRWARDEHADILHCHRGKDHWLGLAVARSLRGLALVRTRHVAMPVARHLLNRYLYLHATQSILCVSNATREGFGPWQARLPGGGPVIHSAIETERFKPELRSEELRAQWNAACAPLPAGETPLWFGLVGRMQRVKGHRIFVDAAGLIARRCPNARFFVAGLGEEDRREYVRIRARQCLVGDRFLVCGALDNLPATLATLDVGVIASLGSEGSSRIALEMMASGLPLAATTVGSIPELVTPAGGARLVPPQNADALAEAMLAWAQDPLARQAAAQANRAWVLNHHQPRQWAEKIVKEYQRALGK